jgi:hypothetical protein
MHSKSKPFAGRDFPLEHANSKRYLPSHLSERQVETRIKFTIAFRFHKRAFVFSNSALLAQLPTPSS